MRIEGEVIRERKQEKERKLYYYEVEGPFFSNGYYYVSNLFGIFVYIYVYVR
jgi:hypothetical protein